MIPRGTAPRPPWAPSPARLLAAVGLVTVAVTAVSLLFPPVLGGDLVQMCRAWDHFLRTGEFNRLPTLDPAGIARPTSAFVTWWSPGAQLLLGLPEFFALPRGWSLSLWLGVTSGLTWWGCARLYRRLGFGEGVVAAALLIGAVGWHALYPFRQFSGAEPFAIALFPWLCVWLLDLSARPLAAGVVLAAVAYLGTLIKLSFFITAVAAAAATLCATFATTPPADTRLRTILRQAAMLGAGLAVAWWAIQAGFLSRGATPATSWATDFPLSRLVHAFAMAAVLPLSAVLAFGSIGGRVCDAMGWPHLEQNPPLLAGAFLATVAGYLVIWHHVADRRYRAWLAGMLLVHVAAFTHLYFGQAAVSFEDRHLRPVALLLLPGIVACVAHSGRRLVCVGAGLLLLAAATWGVASYVNRIAEIAARNQISYRGYSLWLLPAAVEAELQQLDATAGAGEMLVCSPVTEVLLAFRRHRAVELTLSPGPPALRGRLPRVVVVLPPDTDALPVLSRFVDIAASDWQHREVARWSIHESRSGDRRRPVP